MEYLRILENARRLIADSRHLFEHGRCRSAIALAILSAEEIGKLVILALPLDLRHKNHEKHLSSHQEKLSAFSSLVMFQMSDKFAAKALEAYGLPNSKDGRRKIFEINEELTKQHPEILEQVGLSKDGKASSDYFCWSTNAYLMIFGSEDGLGDAAGQIGTGIANKLKQYGLYTDTANVSNLPFDEPDEEHARRWLLAVEQTLDSLVLKATLAAFAAQVDSQPS